MLRKSFLLLVPILVLLGTVTTVVAFERQRVPDWRSALQSYLALHETEAIALRVEWTIESHSPWQMQPQMGVPFVSGDQWLWHVERVPFPPDALYCVVVVRTPTALAPAHLSPMRQVLYVAHHDDLLWRTGWLVHEGQVAAFDAEIMDELAAVGCDVEMK